MVALFFRNNTDYYAAELKNVKTAVSARESYVDDAVGYVQLHREGGICTLKCKMCPEHKVRTKPYNVTLIVNENNSKIINCECYDCAVSAGGCRHAVAFLMWVHRSSEEPACTSVECYWRKPTLSGVGTTLKYIIVGHLSKTEIPCRLSSSLVYDEFILEAKKRKNNNCELLKYQHDFKHSNVMQYSLHCFLMDQSLEIKADVDKVIDVLKEKFTKAVNKTIEEVTRKQNKSSIWYEMRYGCITASKAHEVSVCHTPDGTLTATIMGAKVPTRNRCHKKRQKFGTVRPKNVQNKLKKKFNSCGLFICADYPMIAASPDGITKDALIEIKCPSNSKTKDKYLKNGALSEKCKAQVQLQMHAAGVKMCYFCVADSKFEETQNVDIALVTYDSDYVNGLIQKLTNFWKSKIYPILNCSTSR